MKYVLILFGLILSITVKAQDQSQDIIDSIIAVLPSLPDDTTKVGLYGKLIALQYSIDPKAGISSAEAGLALAEKLHWPRGIANLNNSLGLLLAETDDLERSRRCFEKSLEINQNIGSKINIVNNYNNLGRSYRRQADYTKATDYFYKALSVAEEIKSYEKMALVGTNLTALFINQENYTKAKEYAEMTLENARKAQEPRHEVTGLHHLGLIYLDLGDTLSAKSYFDQALTICNETNNLVEKIKVLMSRTEINAGDPVADIKLREELQVTIDQVMPESLIAANNLHNLGVLYINLYKDSEPPGNQEYLDSARLYLTKGLSLARVLVMQDQIAEALQRLSFIDAERGNYKSALARYQEGQVIKDSIYSQETKNQIAAADGERQLAIKEGEIKRTQLEVSLQKKQKLGLLAGLVLFLIIGVLLYRQVLLRKKMNTTLMVLNDQLDEANKIKSKFFAILSHDLRAPVANLISFLHLQKEDNDLLSPEAAIAQEQRITRAAENLLQNMESMLLWSKGQMENFKPEIKSIPVQLVFDYLRDLFADYESIRFEFVNPAQLQINTDENYLKTIMQNLTANAVKVLQNQPDGKITWNAYLKGENICITISDNGPGLSQEQAKQLFEKESVVNLRTGLGFHIIRDLAKAIGCQVSLINIASKGTHFELAL
jgi:signal transduction histidine kinase